MRHHKNLALRARRATAISFFLFKRFASLLLTLLAASVVVFTVLDVLPGNAAEVMLGESATPESVAALSAKLGLDQPALVRYGDWMKGLATGELGTSIAYDTPIAQLVGERLAVTLPLALMAMGLTTAVAFVLGRPVIIGWRPALIRIISIHGLELLQRIRAHVLFVNNTIRTDNERLHSSDSILRGRSRQRKAADHRAFYDKIHLTHPRCRALSF